MRHLSVPKRKTEYFAAQLRAKGWAAKGYHILSDGECNLLPLAPKAPTELPDELGRVPMVELERQTQPDTTHWQTFLANHVSPEVIEKHTGEWPNAQEHFGDIILFKLEDSVLKYAQEIAIAKLEFSKKSRLVLLDGGVVGPFRLRNLSPIAARLDGEILGREEINNLPAQTNADLTTCRARISEYGAQIIVDPTKAYYSTRLANERAMTVTAVMKLAQELGRPLSIADPYCGVGPALIQLLRQPDLVYEYLATDLNPEALPLLEENLRANSTLKQARLPYDLENALHLTDKEELKGRFDVLLVNLPHDTINHLSHLLPLLQENTPALLRGWLVAEESLLKESEEKLNNILTSKQLRSPLTLEIRRQYSTNKVLTRFSVILEPTTG